MNKIKEVAKLLGVELGERFIVKGSYKDHTCHLTYTGLRLEKNSYIQDGMLVHLLTGEFIIEKIPFKPKYDELYYVVDSNGLIESARWFDCEYNYYHYNACNCFRTKKEITEEIKEKILKEMKSKHVGAEQ